MERNCTAKQVSVVEFESNDARPCLAAVLIQLCARRNEWQQKLRINHIIQKREVIPIRGEKCALLSRCNHVLLMVVRSQSYRESRAQSMALVDVHFGSADPAQLRPGSEPLAHEERSARAWNTGAGNASLDCFCQRAPCTDGAQRLEFALLEAQIIHGVVDAVRGKIG